MNVSDSERIAGFLELHKFKPTKEIEKTDLVIFNTCGVRQTAEDRVYGQIHNLRESNPNIKIVLTGCLANRKDVQRKLKDKVDLFCEIKDFPEKIKPLLIRHPERAKRVEGSTNDYLKLANDSNTLCQYKVDSSTPLRYARNDNSYLNISPKYSDKKSAFVPIMTGCNNFCSYCVVPYARGREWSRPIEDIISEIDALSKKGCKEITLLGQNVNSYKYDLSSPQKRGSSEKTKFSDWIPAFAGMTIINFPILIDNLAKSYAKISFKFLTSHPKDFSDELIDIIAKNKNISREIHLPFQAGSDKILHAMNRPYTRKHYLALISKIKKKIPNVGFTTDVIVGFPGETEKDFQGSVKVFKKVKYNEAYINKYSPRPGTAAFRLGDLISWEEKKRREKVLRKLIKS